MSQSHADVQSFSYPLGIWLEECILRVNNTTAAQEMWNGLLTREQQRALGDDLPRAWKTHRGAIRLWQHIQGIEDFALAAVDLAQRLNLVIDHRASRLREALGGHAPPPPEGRPQWDRIARQIRYRGEPVRTVKTHRVPSNLEILLDAFQQAGWPEQIPAPAGFDRDTVRETLRTLNQRLSAIRFLQQAGGTWVQWETVD